MNNNKKRMIFHLNLIITFLLLVSVSFAWFVDLKFSSLSTETSIMRTYFESGDGSEENPFEIARPIQLYYFSWLQQLGFFNMQDLDKPGTVKQYFFYVSTDLDMSGYSIPSIGTISNPFVGKFDGRGHIISNLIVDNSTMLTDIPDGGSIGDQIVGFFGVVGSFNNTPTYFYNKSKNIVTNFCLNNVTVITSSPIQSKSLIGIVAGYVNGTVSEIAVSNSNIQVESGISNLDSTNLSTGFSDFALIGFCEDEYKSSLYVSEILYSQPNVSTLITYTDGGSKNEWGGSVAMQSMYERLVRIFSQSNLSNYTDAPKRVDYFDTNGNLISTASSSETVTSVKKYYDADIGNFYLYSSTTDVSTSSNAFTYSMGKVTRVYTIRETDSNPDGTIITDGTNYLSLSGTTVSNLTDLANATLWTYNGTNGTISAVVNGTTRYLNRNNSSLTTGTSSNNATKWIYDNVNGRLYCENGSRKYYLRYNNGNWSLNRSVPTQSIHAIKVIRDFTLEPTQQATYFPLTVKNPSGTAVNKNNFGVAYNNTGYVISGSQYLYDENNTYRDSDIRVSKYAMSNLRESLGGDSYNSARLEILTRTKNSGGVVRITDNYNVNHPNSRLNSYVAYSVNDLGLLKYNNSRSSLHDLLTGKSYVYGLHFMDATINKDRLVTVEKAVIDHNTYKDYQMPQDSINFTLSSNGYINFYAGTYFPGNSTFFSLHQVFRNKDQLSDDTVLQAFESAGKPTIYKLNDGNFYVYENGVYKAITLSNDFDSIYTQKFEYVYMKSGDPNAPLYYKNSNNNYFTYSNGVFTQASSLPNGYVDINIIADIKEIKEIYGVYTQNGSLNVKYDFIYKFTDGSYSAEITNDYTLAFDTDWITNPSIELNAVYYFEIPANKGEYALGSVPEKDGAYLMYLDLSSNAQEIHRTTITDYVTKNIYSYEYPKGVQVVAEESGYVDDTDSVGIKLPNTFAGGKINITRDGDVVTYTFLNGNNEVIFSYIGDDLVLKDAEGNIATRQPLKVTTVTTRTITQWDYNIITGDTTVTQTITTVNASGERQSVVVKTYVLDINGDLIGEVITDNNGVDDEMPISAVTVDNAALVAHIVSSGTTREMHAKADYNFITDPKNGTLIADEDGEILYCDIIIIVTDNVTGTAAVKIDNKSAKFRLMDEDGNYVRYAMAMSVNGEDVNIGTRINVIIDTAS